MRYQVMSLKGTKDKSILRSSNGTYSVIEKYLAFVISEENEDEIITISERTPHRFFLIMNKKKVLDVKRIQDETENELISFKGRMLVVYQCQEEVDEDVYRMVYVDCYTGCRKNLSIDLFGFMKEEIGIFFKEVMERLIAKNTNVSENLQTSIDQSKVFLEEIGDIESTNDEMEICKETSDEEKL